MSVILAFISGIGVTGASIMIPHARNRRGSIEEFHALHTTLAHLPHVTDKSRVTSKNH